MVDLMILMVVDDYTWMRIMMAMMMVMMMICGYG